MSAMDDATGKWRGILTEFGIDELHLSGKHTACPMCAGKDRFRFLDYQGRGTWVCNQCAPDTADGMELLQRHTGRPFAELAAEIERMVGSIRIENRPAKKDPRALLDHVAGQSKRLTGDDPASLYLKGRGITIQSPHVRWIESFGYFEEGKCTGRYAAMVSRISNAAMERESFHVIYLSNGKKADVPTCKKVLPPIRTINGCGIYLGPVSEHMAVTEGVETGLAVQQFTGLPTVSAISAGGMERLILPDAVRMVTVMADHDENYTGQAAAYRLANRLCTTGRTVNMMIPPEPGDYLDEMEPGQ